jgi:hypothetical protein
MDSSQRGALGLVRLVAFCLIIVGLLDGGIYLTEYVTPIFEQHQHHQLSQPHGPLNILRLILDSIPVIAGIVILIKARAVAEWVADLIE